MDGLGRAGMGFHAVMKAKERVWRIDGRAYLDGLKAPPPSHLVRTERSQIWDVARLRHWPSGRRRFGAEAEAEDWTFVARARARDRAEGHPRQDPGSNLRGFLPDRSDGFRLAAAQQIRWIPTRGRGRRARRIGVREGNRQGHPDRWWTCTN